MARLFRHQGSKTIVVAEHAIHLVALVARDGVVLVQDGDDAELEHGGGGVTQVAPPLGSAEVEFRHQQLPNFVLGGLLSKMARKYKQ